MKRSDSPIDKSFRTEIILTVLLVVLTIASGFLIQVLLQIQANRRAEHRAGLLMVDTLEEFSAYAWNEHARNAAAVKRLAGLPEQNIHYAEPENPEEILRQLKSWQEEGVTGLFSFCDVEAWSLITMMDNAGMGRAFSIVGFDNIMRYINFPKPICTIDPNLGEEAVTAIDLMRKRIHDPSLPPQQVILPVSLVCRNTCSR